MGKIVISIVLGFLSPFALMIGAEPFEVHGRNSVKEVLAGCIAVALYLAVCQFLVARSSDPGLRADSAAARGSGGEAIPFWQHRSSRIGVLLPGWPILAAMIAPLLAVSFLMMATEKRGEVLAPGLPMMLAGCIGCLAGALAARRGRTPARARSAASQAAWPISLRVGAGMFFAVAAILAMVVIPAAAKDTSRSATPGPAVTGFIVLAVLHVFLAALMLKIVGSRMLSVVSGAFGLFIGGLFLVIASDFMVHGPAMRLAATALFVCAGIDLCVCASSVLAAMRGRGSAGTENTPAM